MSSKHTCSVFLTPLLHFTLVLRSLTCCELGRFDVTGTIVLLNRFVHLDLGLLAAEGRHASKIRERQKLRSSKMQARSTSP